MIYFVMEGTCILHTMFTGRKTTKKSQKTRHLHCQHVEIRQMVEKLRTQCHRDSTRQNYYSVWKSFNKFYLHLDVRPTLWEDRIVLFVAFFDQ